MAQATEDLLPAATEPLKINVRREKILLQCDLALTPEAARQAAWLLLRAADDIELNCR